MRFESYEVVCKRTKLDSYLSGNEDVGFVKPTYLPMLTSFRRLSTVAERLFSNKLLCSYYQKITRDSFFRPIISVNAFASTDSLNVLSPNPMEYVLFGRNTVAT